MRHDARALQAGKWRSDFTTMAEDVFEFFRAFRVPSSKVMACLSVRFKRAKASPLIAPEWYRFPINSPWLTQSEVSLHVVG